MGNSTLHNYGLVRFSKKTGKPDTSMVALGKGVIQLWALQNTTKTKACIIVDITERKVVSEYIGTEDGFPEIHKNPEDFEYNIPEEMLDEFEKEIKNGTNN